MNLIIDSASQFRSASAIQGRMVMLTLALVVAVSTTASANNKLGSRSESTYLNPGVEAGLTSHHDDVGV